MPTFLFSCGQVGNGYKNQSRLFIFHAPSKKNDSLLPRGTQVVAAHSIVGIQLKTKKYLCFLIRKIILTLYKMIRNSLLKIIATWGITQHHLCWANWGRRAHGGQGYRLAGVLGMWPVVGPVQGPGSSQAARLMSLRISPHDWSLTGWEERRGAP